MNHSSLKPFTLNIQRALAVMCMAAPFVAHADEHATDLGTVGTQATVQGAAAGVQGAAAVAPTQTSLDATQPQSVISRSFIENSASPVSDFTAIAAIAPSVTGGISVNGPGLSEAKNGIRGFKDGEYNITWDGIPFGDTNGPTHHSTAYFPAQTIGSIVVDRGPGNASNIGNATFGGTIALFSRDLAKEQTFTPYFSIGSWNTRLTGVRFDSGALESLGDTTFAVNYQKETSDGYRTFSALQGENLNFKLQKAISDSTLLTVNTNYNKNYFYQPDKDNGLTTAQVATYGKNYALSDDPTKANYFGYNRTDKSTAMNYVRIQSDLGSGWAIDNNAYYYNYTNTTLASNSGNVPGVGSAKVKTAAGASVSGMPGYTKLNEYDVWGDIFKATKQLQSGLARAGVWYEKADTHRAQYDINLLNMAPSYADAAVPGLPAGVGSVGAGGINNVKFEQNSGWKQYQPFAEFEWAATKDLTVTPGLKYLSYNLNINAAVNQTDRIPQNVSKDYTATLPFLTANYKLNPVWSTYAQYAKGMLVPDISNYYSTNANATDISPQTSTNYQWGVVHKSERVIFDADAYYIDFANKIGVVPGSDANNPIYYNQGGVVYKGLESDVTYMIGSGFSVYANGSVNRAAAKDTGLQISGVPDTTSALGLLYTSGGWSSSLMYKRVGSTYALDNEGYKLDPYSTTNFNVGYTFAHPGLGAKRLKLQLGIFNLANNQDVISVKAKNTTVGSATYGQPNAADTFLFQPERSYMVSAKAEF